MRTPATTHLSAHPFLIALKRPSPPLVVDGRDLARWHSFSTPLSTTISPPSLHVSSTIRPLRSAQSASSSYLSALSISTSCRPQPSCLFSLRLLVLNAVALVSSQHILVSPTASITCLLRNVYLIIDRSSGVAQPTFLHSFASTYKHHYPSQSAILPRYVRRVRCSCILCRD